MEELQLLYFDIEHAIQIHDFIIKKSGGLEGARDLGLLDSVLEHIQNDLYYPTFEEKLTHLFYSVNKLHAFNDGNKRSSIALSTLFLEINGLGHCVATFVKEIENIAVWVADGVIDKELLQDVIHDLVLCEEILESTKLALTFAVAAHYTEN